MIEDPMSSSRIQKKTKSKLSRTLEGFCGRFSLIRK